ncbi:MAG: hypothetical protein P1U64_12415 [Alcanivoracaceae bacterium]|nr:hypothetical protein [Alcanivoracaceae bacterium]
MPLLSRDWGQLFHLSPPGSCSGRVGRRNSCVNFLFMVKHGRPDPKVPSGYSSCPVGVPGTCIFGNAQEIQNNIDIQIDVFGNDALSGMATRAFNQEIQVSQQQMSAFSQLLSSPAQTVFPSTSALVNGTAGHQSYSQGGNALVAAMQNATVGIFNDALLSSSEYRWAAAFGTNVYQTSEYSSVPAGGEWAASTVELLFASVALPARRPSLMVPLVNGRRPLNFAYAGMVYPASRLPSKIGVRSSMFHRFDLA